MFNTRKLWRLSPWVRFLDDPDPANGGGDPPAGYVNPDGTLADNWLSHEKVPEDVRSSKTLGTIKDVPSLARQVVNLEKALGKKRVVLPEGPDDKEGLDAYFREAGWPEKPADYTAVELENLPEAFKTPEALERRAAEEELLRTWAHEARLTKPQLAFLMRKFMQHDVESYQQAEGAKAEALEKAKTELKNTWGAKHPLNTQLARTATTAFSDEAILAHAKEAGWLEDPFFLRLMHAVGGAVSPDRLNARTDGGIDKGSIQQQLDEIMTSDVYLKGTGPAHDNAVSRAMQLREQLHAAG